MRNFQMLIKLANLLLICSIFIGLITQSEAQEKQTGALIIADMQGDVHFLDGENKRVENGKIEKGDILPPDYFAVTGKDGKIIFLLSNGTLMTLVEDTKMKVRSFEQVPFDPGGKTMKDLDNEPSQSNVEIDLNIGSLIVKTKKLDKQSSFEIYSEVGVAGIRGTEFQMQSNPGAGVQLDVSESTVAFTPPGGGQAMPVGQGNGLSVSQTGVPTPRPINPVAAQRISVTNQTATQVTANVSLSSVTGAMNEATSESQSTNDSGDGGSDNEDAKESESGGSDGESSQGQSDSPAAKDNGDIKGAALENNSDATQARKSGKVSALTRLLAKFALNDDQTNRFYMLSKDAQKKMVLEEKAVVQRLLSMDGFFAEQADAFFLYAPETRAQILGLDDSAIVPGLNQRIDEALIAGTLTPEDLGRSTEGNIPTLSVPLATDAEIRELSEKLKSSGHIGVMEELIALSNGELNQEWIRVGEVADIILQDYDWANALPASLTSNEVLDSPFYQTISHLHKELENDSMIYGDATFLSGRNQILEANTQTLFPYFQNGKKTLVISALEELSSKNSIDWETTGQNDTHVVLMAGEKLSLDKGIKLKSDSSDLTIASREDMKVEEVEMDVSKEIGVRGLSDVELNDVTMGASMKATIKARRNLNINGLNFSQGVPDILMEATTIRLSNVNFPVNSAIRLNSLKGPIDGKYPNFGSAIPASQQVGRVNFIKNVATGGNVMNTRQTFDQFGKNIQIGKINRP